VLLLEGGYHLEALAQSAHACVEVLTGRRDSFPEGVSPRGAAAVQSAREHLRTFWPSLG
jgi:hypothetical protein